MNENQVVEQIKERYLQVLEEISLASKRASNQNVKVVVVSKTQPINMIRMAMAAGIRRFGENYIGEALEKIIPLASESLEWHMIGHIQSRKAPLIDNHFVLVHSIDSLKLCNRVSSFCSPTKKLSILLEVNVSGEATKNGFPAWDETTWNYLSGEFEQINRIPNLTIQGLMTMVPLMTNREEARPYFIKTRRLQEYLVSNLPGINWSELSMGTSIDFLCAVEEGATFVRIGEAILGEREGKRNIYAS